MIKTGIVCDTYKSQLFETRLKEEGYKYRLYPGPQPDTITIQVDCPRHRLSALKKLVKETNTAARAAKLK